MAREARASRSHNMRRPARLIFPTCRLPIRMSPARAFPAAIRHAPTRPAIPIFRTRIIWAAPTPERRGSPPIPWYGTPPAPLRRSSKSATTKNATGSTPYNGSLSGEKPPVIRNAPRPGTPPAPAPARGAQTTTPVSPMSPAVPSTPAEATAPAVTPGDQVPPPTAAVPIETAPRPGDRHRPRACVHARAQFRRRFLVHRRR